MANNNETTTKFRVDISELKSAMQEARKQVAYANSEFKASSSAMDDWSKSSDGISAKLKQLNSNLKSQETVLEQYEKTLEEVKKEYGENSAEALEWATKLNNQKAVVNKTKSEIEKFEGALSEVSEAEKIAAKTGKEVSDVLGDMKNKTEEASDGFTIFKGSIATFVGNGLTALASGLKDALGSLVNLASETREYRENMNKLDTAFSTAGFTTEQASKVYKDFYAVLGEEDRSVEAVNHLAKLVDTEKDLQTWTDICTGVWATFGDSLPIEGLTEASNETAKTGKLTGSLADALNWAGQSEEEFQSKLDSLATEQERSAFITETLNGLYSESADEYRKNNKSVMEANKAQSDYTDTLALMGEKIEPLTTTVKQGVTELLNEFLKLVEDVDMGAFTSKIEEAFGVLKDDVLPAIKDGFGWILDNKDTIIAGLSGIAAGFIAFKVASLIQGVISAMQGMTIAQYALNLAMSLNPIGIIIALLSGLVVAFVTLWNKSEAFRNFWIGLWNNIKTVSSNVINAIVNFFTVTIPQALDGMIAFLSQLPSRVWEWLSNTMNKVAEWSSSMINKAKEMASGFVNKIIEWVSGLPSKLGNWLGNVVKKVGTFAVDLSQKGRQAGQNLIDTLVSKVKQLPDKIKSIGSDIVKGLWNGINDMASWIGGKIKGFGEGVLNGIKNFFGIASPSKVMANEVGKWLPEGIAVGINKNAKSTLNAMKDLTMDTVGSARDGLKSVNGGIANGVGGGINYTQIINSPKALNRLDIYRQSKNLLGYAGGGF